MIYFVLNCLLAGLALIAIFKRNENKLSILVFVGVWSLFGIISEEMTYPSYYLYGAALDLIIIKFLSSISKPTTIITILQKVSIISIFLNLFGFICYFANISHTYYDLLYIPLLFITIIAVNKRDDDYGQPTNNLRYLLFCANNIKSGRLLSQNKSKVRD